MIAGRIEDPPKRGRAEVWAALVQALSYVDPREVVMSTEGGRDQQGMGDLRHSIHTPDSWARAVAAAALDAAAADDAFGDSPVELDAKIVVEQRQTASALDSESHIVLGLCINIGGHAYCYGITEHST